MTSEASSFNMRQLIDLAIGSPEPGHVNFYALHCLLYAFAEKMNILDDDIDLRKFSHTSLLLKDKPRAREKKVRRVDHELDEFEPTFKEIYFNRSRTSVDTAAFDLSHNCQLDHETYGRLVGGADDEAAEQQEEQKDESKEEQKDESNVADETPANSKPASEDAAKAQATEAADEAEPENAEVQQKVEGEVEVEREGEGEVEGEFKRDGEHEGERYSKTIVSAKGSPLAQDCRLNGNWCAGITIMKDQLQLAMEELYLLTQLCLNTRSSVQSTELLRALSLRLRAIQNDNTYIEGTYRSKMESSSVGFEDEEMYGEERSLMISESEQEELDEEGGGETEAKIGIRKPLLPTASQLIEQDRYDLELHMCYAPEKLLDQFLDLKSEFCLLTNKVNEMSAQILEADSERTKMMLADLHEQMRELRLFATFARDMLERVDARSLNNLHLIDSLKVQNEELSAKKLDKLEAEILLAEKVDYNQLQRKVSLEQMQQFQCCVEKQFCECTKLIRMIESVLQTNMEDMRSEMGIHAVQDMLDVFKKSIDADIHALEQKLQEYIEMTNDECAAAGARAKVTTGLNCLSCDTKCVMRIKEPSKIGPLPGMQVMSSMGALVTYEKSSLRKSGIMGYYRKGDLPDSANAWLKRQSEMTSAMKMCVPRKAGGANTKITAKDRVQRLSILKK